MNKILDDYDDEMIHGDECGLNFLTFVLQLRKNPGGNLSKETDLTCIETGPAGWEAMALPLDHSGVYNER